MRNGILVSIAVVFLLLGAGIFVAIYYAPLPAVETVAPAAEPAPAPELPPAPSVDNAPEPVAAPAPRPEVALSGVVLGLDMQPAAGATVWAYSKAMPRDFGTATTGANGSFRLAGLSHPAYDVVAVLGDATALALAAPSAEEVKLQLIQRATMQVRVLDVAGNPVPDAETTLARPAENNPDGLADELLAQLNTPPVSVSPGEFTYPLGARGTYQVFASSPTQGSGNSALLVVNESTIRVSVDIKVLIGQSVAGRVVDTVARPIAGASVTLELLNEAGEIAGSGSGISSTTDAQGNFLIEPVAPGTYLLNATANSFAETTLPSLIVHPTGPTRGVQVVMATGGTIIGTCTKAGQPIAGASVSVKGPTSTLGSTTGEDGAYTFEHLPAGTYRVEVSSVAQDMVSGVNIQGRSKVVEVIDGETVELNFESSEGQRVSGTVLGMVPGSVTLVRLRVPGSDAPPAVLTDVGLSSDIFESIVAQSHVTPDGQFAMDSITEGDYLLDVYSFVLTPASPEDLTFGPDADAPKATVEVHVGDAPVTVDVRLP